MLSEVMVKTAVLPGLETGFTQPVMTTLTQPSEDRDIQVVQFRDELEGGGEPRQQLYSRVMRRPHVRLKNFTDRDHKILTVVHNKKV